jgi:site-specific DNA-methyltransferase (adenine-specific)
VTQPATLDIPLTPPLGGEVLYESGRATVVWGDWRDPEVIAAVPVAYGVLCTDPPYGVRWESARRRNGGRQRVFGAIEGDDGTVDWPAVLEGRRGWGVEVDRGYAELMVQRVRAAEKIADQIGKC